LIAKNETLTGRERFGCPENIGSIGRKTWAFLHTMAAYYPEQPSPEQRSDMGMFLGAFSKFYPCKACASHLQFVSIC
jgi:FAD-linked sulfhydryl oxidase